MIRFPHLGITLPHVLKSVSVGGFEIACYGIVLSIAMVTGLLLAMRVAKTTGQNPDDYFDLGLTAIVISVICARIYYVVFSWDYYGSHLSEIINLRQGGLAIYGGVIGGVTTVLIFAKLRKMGCFRALDTAVIGLVWGQALGRWGNFFNREAFGDYTDGLLAMQLPVNDVRAGEITETMRAHVQTVDGISCVQVHPTFLYESLWNLGVLLLLLFLTFHIRKKFDGMIFLSYLLLYGLGRFWIEGLRTDQLLWPGTDLAVSQILSGILIIASAALLAAGKIHEKGTKEDGHKRTIEKKD